MARKTYTREFKLQALRMVADQGLSVAEVARRLGVGENCLRTWRKSAREHGAAAFPSNGHLSPADTSWSVPWMGFEPMLSTLREWRPLRAGPPGHFSYTRSLMLSGFIT